MLTHQSWFLNFLAVSLSYWVLPYSTHAQEMAIVPMQVTDPFHMKTWNTDVGLPQNSIIDIIQTEDGYLWMTTFGGLVRFDGVEFDIYDLSSSPGLTSNRLINLYEDRDNALWITHEYGGMTVYRDGVFTRFAENTGFENFIITDVIQDENLHHWIATMDGLLKFADGDITRFTTDDGLPTNEIKELFIDNSGNILAVVGTAAGREPYGKWTNGSLVKISEEVQMTAVPFDHEFQDVYLDSGNVLWLGGHKLSRLINNQVERLLTGDDLNVIRVIFKDTSGNIWVGAQNRLSVFRESDLEAAKGGSESMPWYRFREGLTVRAILQDREGNIWLGTAGKGLIFLRSRPIQRYFLPDEFLVSKNFNPVVSDRKGGMWLGTLCGGLTHFDGKVFRSAPLGNLCVGALLLDSGNELWLSDGRKLGQYKNGIFKEVREQDSPGFTYRIQEIFEDREGVFWIGTNGNGLFQLKEEVITHYNEENGLKADNLYMINQSRDGSIWIGSDLGLSRLSGNTFTNYTSDDGLSPGAIRSIYEDDEEVLWIGSYGGGLTRWKEGRFVRFTSENGLLDNVISRIAEDEHQRLWMLGNQGLFFADKSLLNDFADGQAERIVCISFGSEDGMAEGNGAGRVVTTANGLTWWPTIEGVAGIDINSFRVDTIPPTVVIKRVMVANQQIDLRGGELFLDSKHRDFEVTYTGLSYDAPEKVKFMYRLEGYDTDWIAAGNRRSANYTNLPSGDYVFRLKAANRFHVWSDAGLSLRIQVTPTVWETTWARLLFFGLIVVIITGAFRWRTAYLRQRKVELERLVAERTETLENALLDLKRAQKQLVQSEKLASLGTLTAGIAHEINNPVNFIINGIEALDTEIREVMHSNKKPNSRYLKEVQNLLDSVKNGAHRTLEIVDSLRTFSRLDEDAIKPYDIEANFKSTLLILRNKMDGKIQVKENYCNHASIEGYPGKLNQLFMNILDNAIQAILDSSGTGEIQITTEVVSDRMHISITDTGPGIDEDHLSRIFDPFFTTKDIGKGTGLGLSISHAIVEEHKGTINVNSQMGKGTEFVISLPLVASTIDRNQEGKA